MPAIGGAGGFAQESAPIELSVPHKFRSHPSSRPEGFALYALVARNSKDFWIFAQRRRLVRN